VGAGHDGRTYAEGILNVCEHYVASSLKCAAGVSGADLKRRVIEISELGRARIVSALSVQKRVLLGAFALATLIVPIILGAVSTKAAAQGGDEIPLVRTPPTYPPEALAQRLEGWAKIEFTITSEGTVADAVVVDSSSPEFNEPTLTAVQNWRYSPRPIARQRVQTIIRYTLAL
jgi:TonB family protein